VLTRIYGEEDWEATIASVEDEDLSEDERAERQRLKGGV
jgi:hypothetical protein